MSSSKIELAEEILGLSFVSPGFLLESMFLFTKLLIKFSETKESENIDEQKMKELQQSAYNLSISQDKKIIKLLASKFTEEELETLLELIKEPLVLKFFLLIGTTGEIKTKILSMQMELIKFVSLKLKDLIVKKIKSSEMN